MLSVGQFHLIEGKSDRTLIPMVTVPLISQEAVNYFTATGTVDQVIVFWPRDTKETAQHFSPSGFPAFLSVC